MVFFWILISTSGFRTISESIHQSLLKREDIQRKKKKGSSYSFKFKREIHEREINIASLQTE